MKYILQSLLLNFIHFAKQNTRSDSLSALFNQIYYSIVYYAYEIPLSIIKYTSFSHFLGALLLLFSFFFFYPASLIMSIVYYILILRIVEFVLYSAINILIAVLINNSFLSFPYNCLFFNFV